ncbi:hypothetical protein BIV57_19865 [Mangrovactinospora gilvigrisea]|uniref:Glycosyl hydrolase family 95 catalytic domain-containing protein n=1 Tax=Mangrovactinospora gilvigrisea TaxID=1428644 RepID=A0A1J7C2E7_9ACTN|nr:hypothetical protein BIV57_19865 [Mangrovactinospora gilvigrisea]
MATAPPKNLVTVYLSDGALLGNGNLGVVVGDTGTTTQKFWFANKNHFGMMYHTKYLEYRTSQLSIAQLTVSSPDPVPAGVDPAAVYRAEQRIRDSRSVTTVQLGGARATVTGWTADSDDTLVVEVALPEGAPETRIDLTLGALTPSPGYQLHYPTASGVSGGAPWIARTGHPTTEPPWYSTQAVALRRERGAAFDAVSSTPGDASTAPTATGRVVLRGGQSVRVAAALRGDARPTADGPSAPALAARAAEAASAAGRRIDALAAEHAAWWRAYWLRSWVDLGDPVLEQYYYGALHLMGAAAREGELPPGLWGSWVVTDVPNWQGRDFLNYNYQAPFYGLPAANRADALRSYAISVLDELPYQRNTTAAAGYQGIAYQRTLMPLHHGLPAPAAVPVAPTTNQAFVDQKSNGSFAIIPVIWYWEYTQDDRFLKRYLYPAMRGLEDFWQDYLTFDGTHWNVEHSSAHEGSDDLNPDLDLGFIRKLYTTLIAASERLGADLPLNARREEVLAKLAPAPVGVYQGTEVYLIAEAVRGSTDISVTFEPGNQPINLEGLVHPGENVSLGVGAEADRQRVLDSLRLQAGWGQGNAYAKVFVIAARAGWDGADLIEKFKARTAQLWRPSNLTPYCTVGGIEVAGPLEALNSLLMTSEGGTVRLFPSWPRDRDASFTDLRAKGAFLVSAELSGGRITSAEVRAERGGLCRVAGLPGGTKEFRTQPGGRYRLV